MNIRKFGDVWKAIREPQNEDYALVKRLGLIKINSNTWIDGSFGFTRMDEYKEMFKDKSIYLISNRHHYLGPKDDDVTREDITEDWPVFCINYSVEQAIKVIDDRSRIFSFWQDNVPRPTIIGPRYVFGPLIPQTNDKAIRINPLAMNYKMTPKTLHLALRIASYLGVTYVRIFNASPDHPVNQMIIREKLFSHITLDFDGSKDTGLAHVPIDLSSDFTIDQSIVTAKDTDVMLLSEPAKIDLAVGDLITVE